MKKFLFMFLVFMTAAFGSSLFASDVSEDQKVTLVGYYISQSILTGDIEIIAKVNESEPRSMRGIALNRYLDENEEHFDKLYTNMYFYNSSNFEVGWQNHQKIL